MIVRDYVSSAAPVGSEALARRYHLTFSSATVRNEMAELEHMGYITHPHTSAGRIPTDKGYRYFVARLMDEFELPAEEQRTIRHQFHQVELALDQWIHLAASVLARASHNVALVTMPTARQCRLRHLELLAMHDQVVLMLVVLQEGRLHQQMIALPAAVDEDELSRVARRITALFAGRSAAEIDIKVARNLVSLSEAERGIVEQLTKLMRQVDTGATINAHYDGLLEVLRQPEFARADKVRMLVEALEQRDVWPGLLPAGLPSGEVWLAIGEENPWAMLRDCSLVFARYGEDDAVTGVLGVIGPTRMPYWRAIATVRCLSTVMGDLITTLTPAGRS
jgi:heat-inducible transcriptional repressor